MASHPRVTNVIVAGLGGQGAVRATDILAEAAFLAGLLVLSTHVPLGMQVLSRGIVFIDLAIAQIATLGVIAAVAVPQLVGTRRYHVDVETVGDITRGRTVVDDRGVPGQPPNVDVALDIDRAAFADLMIGAVASYR